MGLLNTYGDYNKVTNTALNVKYSVQQDYIKVTGWHKLDPEGTSSVEIYSEYDLIFYRVTRYATKSYDYVGMNYATAVQCQNDKISKYTRGYSNIVIKERTGEFGKPEKYIDTETSTLCTSDIVAQHNDGNMWQVSINVNEVDEKSSLTLPQNPASLFTTENQRNYDE